MLAGLDIGDEAPLSFLALRRGRRDRLGPGLLCSLALHVLLAVALMLAVSHLLRPVPEPAAFRVDVVALGTAGSPPGDREVEPARKSAAEPVAAPPETGRGPAPSGTPTASPPVAASAPAEQSPVAVPPGVKPPETTRLDAPDAVARGEKTVPASRPVSAKPAAAVPRVKPSAKAKDAASAAAPSSAPPAEDLAARLAALRQQQALAQSRKRPSTADDPGAPDGLGPVSGTARYDPKDFIRAQVERRWVPDLSGGSGRTVAIHVTIDRDGSVRDAQIIADARAGGPAYRALAMSARNAVLLSSPLSLPPGRYDEVRDIVLEFDPRKVLP